MVCLDHTDEQACSNKKVSVRKWVFHHAVHGKGQQRRHGKYGIATCTSPQPRQKPPRNDAEKKQAQRQTIPSKHVHDKTVCIGIGYGKRISYSPCGVRGRRLVPAIAEPGRLPDRITDLFPHHHTLPNRLGAGKALVIAQHQGLADHRKRNRACNAKEHPSDKVRPA